MAFDEALAERIRKVLSRRKNVEEMKIHGGIGFLLNGHKLVSVWRDFLIVRLGPEDEVVLVKEFDTTGQAMKGCVLVEPEGVRDDDQLRAWIQRAVKFVRTLPAKEKE